MAMLTLDEAKQHLRVDGTDDDAYITSLVAAAEEYIVNVITPAPVDGVVQPAPSVNETQRHAARLLVGHWYENREAVAQGTIIPQTPFAVDMLLLVNRPADGLI